MMKMLLTYTSTLRFLLKLLEMLNNNYSSAKTKFLGLMLILILGKLIYTTLYTTFSGDPSTVVTKHLRHRIFNGLTINVMNR